MRDGLLSLPGIHEVSYDAAQDLFTVRYEAGRIGISAMFQAVHQAGRRLGREYVPEIVTES